MEDIRLSYNELVSYAIVLNALLGVMFGSFPLLAGIVFKNRKYGLFGFVGSVLGGAILGFLLAFPVAIIFVWLILRKPAAGTTEKNSTEDAHSEETMV